jgi:aquaporin Z
VLATTKPSFPWKIAGLSIGFTLIAVHLFSIPVTNTSVNFARSLGTAVIAGSAALKQLWLFALAQLLASVIAVVIHKALDNK